VGTAAALHLAASLPNFFIQQLPFPAAEEDRAMRAALSNSRLETPEGGFLALPQGHGLGVAPDVKALEQYREAAR
jgi:L-alanine-DL-glutamate epimerase-like enolase superfamily enzyme